MNCGLLFQKISLGTQELLCKVSDQLDTRLNNYGLISNQSMLIYHLKLISVVYRKWLLGYRKINDIFYRKDIKEALIGIF